MIKAETRYGGWFQMKYIQLNNVMGFANCRNQSYSSSEGFPKITMKLWSGKAYGVLGEYGLGAWGLVNCIGGAGELISGEILVDGNPITKETLFQRTCFVSEMPNVAGLSEEKTVRETIEVALQTSKQPYSAMGIKELFELSDERFDREISQISGEIRQVSMAVGFAFGKDIFCYPWLISNQISRYLSQKAIHILREHNKLILIPTANRRDVRGFCNAFLEILPKGILLPRHLKGLPN